MGLGKEREGQRTRKNVLPGRKRKSRDDGGEKRDRHTSILMESRIGFSKWLLVANKHQSNHTWSSSRNSNFIQGDVSKAYCKTKSWA